MIMCIIQGKHILVLTPFFVFLLGYVENLYNFQV